MPVLQSQETRWAPALPPESSYPSSAESRVPTISVRHSNGDLTVFDDPGNVFFPEDLLRRLRVFNAPHLVLCAPLMVKAKLVPFKGGHRCIWCDGERKSLPAEARAKFNEEELWELWGEWPA